MGKQNAKDLVLEHTEAKLQFYVRYLQRYLEIVLSLLLCLSSFLVPKKHVDWIKSL